MSTKSGTGKAAWAARSAAYRDELEIRIRRGAEKQIESWSANGRIPFWPRFTARLAGRPFRPLDERTPQ